MGNTNQKGGDTNFVQNNIEKFIQQMVDKNLTEPYSNNYCKNIQLVIKDELLTKLTKSQLLEKNANYSIGIALDSQSTKKEICGAIAQHYMVLC